jgi:hypothetical protein
MAKNAKPLRKPIKVVFLRFHPEELEPVRRAIQKRMEAYHKSPREIPKPNLTNFIIGAAVDRANLELAS